MQGKEEKPWLKHLQLRILYLIGVVTVVAVVVMAYLAYRGIRLSKSEAQQEEVQQEVASEPQNTLTIETTQFGQTQQDLNLLISTAEGYTLATTLEIDDKGMSHLRHTAMLPNENLDTALRTSMHAGKCTEMSIQYKAPVDTKKLQARKTLLEKQKDYYTRVFEQTSYSEDSLTASVQLTNVQEELDELEKALLDAEQLNNYTEVTFVVNQVKEPFDPTPLGIFKMSWNFWYCVIMLVGVPLVILVEIGIPILIIRYAMGAKKRAYDAMVRRAVTPMTLDTFRDKVHPQTEEEGNKDTNHGS